VNTIPIPTPGPNQFLVKIASASLCASDLHSIDDPTHTKPVTLGHEGAGYISAIHPSAEGHGFKVGDAIGFLYIVGCCFECAGCQVHNLHCETGRQLLQGFSTDGFFAEYAVVDWQNAVILPPSLDPSIASPIFCAGITSFHSVDSAELKPGDWFGVVGCGGLGQLATQYAKAMGARVVGVDVNDAVLDACKAQGAEVVFNSRTDPDWAAKIKKLTGGGVATCAVYSNAQVAYATAPSIIRLGGVLMVIGIAHQPLQVSATDLATGVYRIKAESTSIPQRMGRAIEFTAKHHIVPEVQTFGKLEDLAEMVDIMRSGKMTKRMVVSLA
jgi:propanol-preferring alcohol dehydrogenase